jgi:protein-S-isoprenylcysteine O-methyltransferase Ste14
MSIPPPLLYAVPLIAGIVIGRWLPLLWLPGKPLRIVGTVLTVAGLAFGGWARVLFDSYKTSVVPIRPVTAIIEDGPFGISRNPIYVAFALIYAGVALLCRAVWPLLLLPLVLLGIAKQVRREETYLERRFGAEYLNYKARVRRWL